MLQQLNYLQGNIQRGISLIESLVAIVIMALGILGILGVQIRTLGDTQTSVRRAQAVRLISDLSERIQVSPNGLGDIASYEIDWASTVNSSLLTKCKTVACDHNNLATYDVASWLQSVRDTLPLGDARIFMASGETDATNRRQLGVMISWRENERRIEKDGKEERDTNYFKVFETAKTAASDGVNCPTDRICHLQYIQPMARCMPYYLGGASNPQIFCP